MHGNTTHLICFRPLHLPPNQTKPNKTKPSYSWMHHQIFSMQTVNYHTRHNLGSVLRDKEADHCGKGDNRNPDGDKEPLETIEGATHGKVYLRDDSCPLNVSSFLDLYAHNLKWLCLYSGKELKIIILSEVHPHIFRLSLIWFSSWHPRPLKLESTYSQSPLVNSSIVFLIHPKKKHHLS